jgi:hypothetical protein
VRGETMTTREIQDWHCAECGGEESYLGDDGRDHCTECEPRDWTV